jgi:hypothetical protein
MKARMLVSILILVFTVLIVVGSCSTGKKAYVAKEDEGFYGTWVNPDYDEGEHWGKLVLKPGAFEWYTKTDSTHSTRYGETTITDKWTDSEGNIWYKYMDTLTVYGGSKDTNPKYGLVKIDKLANTFEIVASGIDYPTEIDPDSLLYTYRIYYRQE